MPRFAQFGAELTLGDVRAVQRCGRHADAHTRLIDGDCRAHQWDEVARLIAVWW